MMDKLFDGSGAHLMTHVFPINDLREHVTDGDCWCRPEVGEDLVVIHNSMDDRESYENGRILHNDKLACPVQNKE